MSVLRRLFGARGGEPTGRATGLVSADQRLDELRRHVLHADRERIEWARELVGAGESVWQVGAGARWFALAAAIRAGARGAVLAAVGEPEEAAQIRADASQLGAFDARLDVVHARFGEREPGKATLDGLLERHRAPTVLRIDLPAALGPVLADGTRLLERARPVLLLEVEARPDPGVLARLRHWGYELFDAERNPADRMRLEAPARHTLAIPKV